MTEINLPRRSLGQRAGTKNSTYHDPVGPPPSRISQFKWTEIQKEECADHVINSIREEIIQSAMHASYKNHLDNNLYPFVVDCAHTAWLQLFNFMHLKCDPGESSGSVEERWTGDEEYSTIPKDNWICGNIATRKTPSLNMQQEKCSTCRASEDSHNDSKNASTSPSQAAKKKVVN